MNISSMRPSNKSHKSFEVLAIFILFFSITNCTHVTTSNQRQPTQSTEKEDRELQASLTEFRNCEKATKRFPTMFKGDTVECTDDYLLYESDELNKSKKTSIGIGSFNIIRIGQAQTRFKRNDFVAQIMNQWDLVNVVEIMTSGKELIAYNEAIDAIAERAGEARRKDIESSYEMPRYLLILKELRKLDPSWSLIMAPRGTGETTSSYEYSGFFYRNGLVQNAKTSFCGDKRGCLTPISRESFENLVSRSPFVARFKIGKLDFNAAGVHLRFRVPAEDCGKTGGADLGKGKKKCVRYSSSEQEIVEEFLQISGRPKINKEDARYLELAIAERVLRNSDEQVMIMGDFNLEFNERNKKLWNFAIGHENVFVHEKTSISAQNGLANEYDHFVFVPEKKLAKCKTETAKSFNFVLDVENPTTTEEALKELSEFLKLRKDKKKALDEYKKLIESLDVVTSCDSSVCERGPRYAPEVTKNLLCLYERNVLGADAKKCSDEGESEDEDEGAAPGKKPIYKVYHEVISDHIPVEMECATN